MLGMDFGQIGSLAKRGLIAEFAPNIVKGALAEFFEAKNMSVAKATKWVEGNVSLWKNLEPGNQEQLKNMARNVGDISWFTAPWVVEAIREGNPALASLFMGWTKARNWLERQIEMVKQELLADDS